MTDLPFNELLAKARAGDESALGELARRYEPDVRAVARVRLGPALRPYLDTMDLVQSVHRSLLVGLRQNKFELTNLDNLVGLAVTMVRRKAARAWQRMRRQLRDTPAGDDTVTNLVAGLTSLSVDPADNVTYRDTLTRLCKDLDAGERRLLELHLQGYRTVDAARELDVNPDVLRVKLSRLRAKLRTGGVMSDWL
jgi:RNA polymerase sigma-70 factor (ECF subfamily)